MCFLDTIVDCQQIVVMPADELYSDDFRDVSKGLVVQDAVNVLPILDQLFRLKLASVFVLLLQLL